MIHVDQLQKPVQWRCNRCQTTTTSFVLPAKCLCGGSWRVKTRYRKRPENSRCLTCWCSKPGCKRCAAADMEWAPDVIDARLAPKPVRLTRTDVLGLTGAAHGDIE